MNGEQAAPAAATNLIDLLNRLAEPPEPAPVSLAPQGPGWWVLAGSLALLLAWLAWRMLRHWRANAYRRAALAELDAAGDDPVAIATILRRTALAVWPRDEVASLSGAAWLRFLDATGGAGGFAAGPGAVLASAPFRTQPAVPGLHELAARWVRHHRRRAGERGR